MAKNADNRVNQLNKIAQSSKEESKNINNKASFASITEATRHKTVESKSFKTLPTTRTFDGNQHRIVYSNSNTNRNNEFIVSNGTKRYNKNKRNGKSITGVAASDVRTLRAVSRPYSYYIGQWSMATKPEMLKKHVSDFAKVIELQELSVNVPNRRFRSFKIVVESYCDQAMWNPINWPGGVVVELFFERKRHTMNQFAANIPITHSKSIVENTENNKNSKSVGSNSSKIVPSIPNSSLKLKKFDSANPEKPNEPIINEHDTNDNDTDDHDTNENDTNDHDTNENDPNNNEMDQDHIENNVLPTNA